MLHAVRDRTVPKKRINSSKKSRFHTHRCNTRKGVLTEKAHKVKTISGSRNRIFPDARLYFIIRFSDSVRFKSVQSALDALGGKITQEYDKTTVKIAVFPEEYEHFAEQMEKQRSLIADVRESNLSDKFDKRFLDVLAESKKPQEVTIEVSDLSGLANTEPLASALYAFVKKTGGKIDLGYAADYFAIFSGKLPPSAIAEIAEQVEVVESVEPAPEISLI